MTELSAEEFNRQVDLLQERIEHALDLADVDVELEQTDGSLILMLAAGPRLVIGRQPASRELWLATPDSTLHFGYRQGEGWRHDSDDEPLASVLGHVIAELIGDELELTLNDE